MIELIVLGTLGAFGVFLLFRNNAVWFVRLEFLDDPVLFPGAYMALPSYDQMLVSPRHWTRWTKAQWVAWVEAQP